MKSRVVIVDCGIGNLRSVQKKYISIGSNALISSNLDIISNATKLVLPGVGHFSTGVKRLRELGIWDVLNEMVLNKNIPILGICLGMQLMSTHSEEGNTQGLGWFDATVVKFKIKNTIRYKIPHMGWNDVKIIKQSPLFEGIDTSSLFYFVHSYHMICNDNNDIIGKTNYDYEFVSAINKNNIFGVQFHPEKSHDQGKQIIQNYLRL